MGDKPTFWSALLELLFGKGNLDTYSGQRIPVFTLGCGLMGLTVLILDRIGYAARGKSFLKLNYGSSLWITLRLFCLWGLGAALAGFLGAALDAFQFTRNACVGVGIGWPAILPRLIDASQEEKEDEQPPEN